MGIFRIKSPNDQIVDVSNLPLIWGKGARFSELDYDLRGQESKLIRCEIEGVGEDIVSENDPEIWSDAVAAKFGPTPATSPERKTVPADRAMRPETRPEMKPDAERGYVTRDAGESMTITTDDVGDIHEILGPDMTGED